MLPTVDYLEKGTSKYQKQENCNFCELSYVLQG